MINKVNILTIKNVGMFLLNRNSFWFRVNFLWAIRGNSIQNDIEKFEMILRNSTLFRNKIFYSIVI